MISKDIFSNTYPIKKLGEVVIFLDSKRKPVKESERVTGIYPYYGANGLQGWINDYIFDDELILLAEDGGHFNNPDRGVAYKITGKTWVNNHAHVIKPLEDLNIDYLCRVLENYDLRTWITGTTRAKLTKGGASEILIPLPPLTEQKRIAQILDKADELRQKRQQSIDKLDELLQATFIDMFGDPISNSNNLKVVELSQLCQKVTDGTHQSPKWENEGIPFLFISNIVNGEIDYSSNKYISQETYNQLTKSTKIEINDILYTTVGSYGNVARVKTDKLFCFQRHIGHIKPNQSKVNAVFLENMLSSFGVKMQADRLVKGVAQKTLNLKDLKSLLVFDIPIIEQENFVKISNKIKMQKQTLTAQLTEQENLFKSLQQRAFKGEL